jgi:hypothetical protein
MQAINVRVRSETLALVQSLVRQRGIERADLLREALHIGLHILAASGPPAADAADDTYGTLSGLRQAQSLRPRIAVVLDFLSRYGATPAIGASVPVAVPIVAAASQTASARVRDAAVQSALDGFGVGALGDDV